MSEEQKALDEQKAIDDYVRVEAFLADPAVKSAIRKVSDGYYEQFRSADTAEKQQQVWAKSRSLDELSDELMRTMDNGRRAKKDREARELREERDRARRTPRAV